MLTIGWMKIFTIFSFCKNRIPHKKKIWHKVTQKLLVARDGPTFSVDMMVRARIFTTESGGRRCLLTLAQLCDLQMPGRGGKEQITITIQCELSDISINCRNSNVLDRLRVAWSQTLKKHTNLCPYTEQIIFFRNFALLLRADQRRNRL